MQLLVNLDCTYHRLKYRGEIYHSYEEKQSGSTTQIFTSSITIALFVKRRTVQQNQFDGTLKSHYREQKLSCLETSVDFCFHRVQG